MAFELRVIVVVVALHRGVFDRPVHPLDLSVGLGVVRLGQPVLDPTGLADHVEPYEP